jgi:hypothetical protein
MSKFFERCNCPILIFNILWFYYHGWKNKICYMLEEFLLLNNHLKVNMHHKCNICFLKIDRIKYSSQNHVYYMLSSLPSLAQLIGFSNSALWIPCSAPGKKLSMEYKELSKEVKELISGKQRAEHRKLKSWAKNRHISGRITFQYKYLNIKHFMMNWNTFRAF